MNNNAPHRSNAPLWGDLGANIGSARWWRDCATLLAGITAAMLLAFAPLPEASKSKGAVLPDEGSTAPAGTGVLEEDTGPLLTSTVLTGADRLSGQRLTDTAITASKAANDEAAASALETTAAPDGAAAPQGQPQPVQKTAIAMTTTSPAAPARNEVGTSINQAGLIDIMIPYAPGIVPEANEPTPRRRAVTATVGRGDTLMAAVVRAGVPRRDAFEAISALSDHVDPRKVAAGQALELQLVDLDGSTRLDQLSMRDGLARRVVSRRTGDAFAAHLEDLPATSLVAYAEGTITDSLYLSAERAGVPIPVIVELIRILSWDIDFQREIRAGDRFEVAFERKVVEEDGLSSPGDVVFVRMTLRGNPISLYRFTPESGRTDYFNQEGKSARKALLATPVDGARLTSSFGRRKHPVLGYTRIHKGLDFGAATGTPIMAAGDGVIERASRWGSYGNYVRIRHNGTYKTAYAHLSKYGRGIKAGKRVQQGDIIGYVGATGRVTGPHLHYEVLRDDVQVNPRQLDLPSGITLTGVDMEAFRTRLSLVDSDIARLHRSWQVAHGWQEDGPGSGTTVARRDQGADAVAVIED